MEKRNRASIGSAHRRTGTSSGSDHSVAAGGRRSEL